MLGRFRADDDFSQSSRFCRRIDPKDLPLLQPETKKSKTVIVATELPGLFVLIYLFRIDIDFNLPADLLVRKLVFLTKFNNFV